MKPEEIKEFLLTQGFSPWYAGSQYHKTLKFDPPRKIRYSFSRFELRLYHMNKQGKWRIRKSGYYGRITITAKGNIQGMRKRKKIHE